MVLLFVRKTTGQVLAIDVDMNASVSQLKETITLVEGVESDRQTLIFAGRVLKDGASLSSYNISKECSIQLFTSAVRELSRAPSEVDELLVGAASLRDELQDDEKDAIAPVRTDSEGGVSDALKHGDVVIIKLIEARNLEKADFWPGSSDPYVIFALGNNSAKSKIVKRDLNPVWKETFGFRINEEDDAAVLRVLVFDFDNFTPDDFIGSAEINLSVLKRGETVDAWVDLENVKTGQIHLQFHRSILTSPSLNTVVTSLMELERSWTDSDLYRLGVTLEHLSGKAAWVVEDTTNPAIDHLAESIRNDRIDWSVSSLRRIQAILSSQNLLPTRGAPTSHLWISGIASHVKPRAFVTELRRYGIVKHVKFPTGHSCSIVDFRSMGDALLCFLQMQKRRYQGSQLIIGFGRYLSRDSQLLESCLHAGFLLAFVPGFEQWRMCWVFLSNTHMKLFDDLQSETPCHTIELQDCLVCSQGLKSIEIFSLSNEESIFFRSEVEDDIQDWKDALRHVKGPEGSTSKRANPTLLEADKEKEEPIQGKDEGEQYPCAICHSSYSLDEVYLRDCKNEVGVGEYACVYCLRQRILQHVDSSKCTSLSPDFTVQDIRELLSQSEFNSFLDASLRELLDADDSFVKCPKCSVAVEFAQGQDVPDFTRMSGIDGRALSASAQQHYLSNRLRCRNAACSADFCRSCLSTPYHAGFSCAEHEIYKTAEHCRFCDTALLPRSTAPACEWPALQNVCNFDECLLKREQACTMMLACDHPCSGVRGEHHHPPCLRCASSDAAALQDADDFCNICFTESLSAAPSIQLNCGHFFHYDCSRRRLRERWPTPQITFGFCECPLCKTKMHHDLLLEDLSPIFSLHREVELKSYQRLEYENLLGEPDLQKGGEYYRNASAFGLKYFAYYMCFTCKEPYFGGQPRCDDGLDHFDPSELICGACSGIGVAECSKHGKAFMLFKCRFCCSPSSWYCWGTTHFCDSCHRRQEAHDYLTTKSIEELDKCPGPDECPLGIEHPPNGTEYSLGCSLCRGGSSN